jgi:hypothetical protein
MYIYIHIYINSFTFIQYYLHYIYFYVCLNITKPNNECIIYTILSYVLIIYMVCTGWIYSYAGFWVLLCDEVFYYFLCQGALFIPGWFYLFVYLFVCLFVYSFIYLFICLFIYLLLLFFFFLEDFFLFIFCFIYW